MRILFLSLIFFQMLFCQKTAIIVTGPESSGSTLLAREISSKIGWKQCEPSMTPSEENKGNICVHMSQPTGHNIFWSLAKIRKVYRDYTLKFIITTRDQNICIVSKKRRWGRKHQACLVHKEKSKAILSEIMQKEDYFIWNYETMIYLDRAYSDALFKFLEIECSDTKINFFDGNRKYIRGHK